MANVSHQTVVLARGAHGAPEDGVCVMELASMLAGERFSDRPRAVCPLIAGYLRALNGSLGDGERHVLFPYASAEVGTNADVGARRRRLEWCRRELEAIDVRRSWARRLLRPLPGVQAPGVSAFALERFGTNLLGAMQCASRHWRARASTLADELIAIQPVPTRPTRHGAGGALGAVR